MYPRRDIRVDASIPPHFNYWVPKPSETDEEGYGLSFRDVWALSGISEADARGILAWEKGAAEWASTQAADEEGFEALAKYLESYNPDDEPDDPPFGANLPDELRDSDYSLWGTELGVAGLSHVMAATGFFPVASCRSHIGHSWSFEPVVLFTADEQRVRDLQPLVASARCGFDTEPSRGRPLLVVNAPSIVEIMDLARRLFDKRQEFGAMQETSRTKHGAPQRTPPTLF